MSKKLTKADKVHLVAGTPELINAINLLVTLMKTEKINKFIQYNYTLYKGTLGEENYKFRFEKVTKHSPPNKNKKRIIKKKP